MIQHATVFTAALAAAAGVALGCAPATAADSCCAVPAHAPRTASVYPGGLRGIIPQWPGVAASGPAARG